MSRLDLDPGLALIFDLDGVIVESTDIHIQAWIEYLRRAGVSGNGILERMHGQRNDHIVRTLWGGSLTEDEVHAHGAAKERLYREMMGAVLEQRLVRGLGDFLAATRGARRAVASNAEPANIDFVIDRAGLRSCFASIVDGHQVTHPKPHPEVFLLAAARLGAAPGACVVFEDSAAGVAAARAAGMRVAGLETTLRPVPDCDLSIADFRDERLIPWLTSLHPR